MIQLKIYRYKEDYTDISAKSTKYLSTQCNLCGIKTLIHSAAKSKYQKNIDDHQNLKNKNVLVKQITFAVY